MRTVLVLGGYGRFGSTISKQLARDSQTQVLVGGRDFKKAEQFVKSLGRSNIQPLQIDLSAPSFTEQLSSLQPAITINTAGPFQSQDTRVVEACIHAKSHYLDIADARNYVCATGSPNNPLHSLAAEAKVLICSGASSLPALSSAVVDEVANQFSRIDQISHSISTGSTLPGRATLDSVLSYLGHPFEMQQDGKKKIVYGWQGLKRHKYPPPVNSRFILRCDVPDLELFPQRYNARTVQFHAGTSFSPGVIFLWCMSWMVRFKLIHSLQPYSSSLASFAKRFEPYASPHSAMTVEVKGISLHNTPLIKTWNIVARNNEGLNIPTLPVIAMTKKLLNGEIQHFGTLSCMDILNVNDILKVDPTLDFTWGWQK